MGPSAHIYVLIIVTSLFITSLFVAAQKPNPPYHPDLEWVNATLPFLKKAFSPSDFSALLFSREERNKNLTKESFLIAPVNQLEALCSSIYLHVNLNGGAVPPSATHLPQYVASSDKTTDALLRITDLLVAFNESNRILVLIGDSITRNSLEALECILNIESGFGSVQTTPPLLLNKKLAFGANFYEFHFPHPVSKEVITLKLFYLAIWEKFKTNNVGWITSEVKGHVFSRLHQEIDLQALFVLNIGLHEKSEREYSSKLFQLFQYVKSTLLPMGMNSSRNNFVFRETSAQHFDWPAGYYPPNLMLKVKNNTATNMQKKKKSYQCVPSALTDNSAHDWRHRAEEQAMNRFHFNNYPHQFAFVPFHALTRHYHDLHPYALMGSRKKHNACHADCTHFEPKAAIILFRMLWHDLLVTFP